MPLARIPAALPDIPPPMAAAGGLMLLLAIAVPVLLLAAGVAWLKRRGRDERDPLA